MPRDGASIRGGGSRDRSEAEGSRGDLSVSRRAARVNHGRPVSFSIWGSQKVMPKRSTHQPAPAQSSLPNVSSMEKPLAPALPTLAAFRLKRQSSELFIADNGCGPVSLARRIRRGIGQPAPHGIVRACQVHHQIYRLG